MSLSDLAFGSFPTEIFPVLVDFSRSGSLNGILIET